MCAPRVRQTRAAVCDARADPNRESRMLLDVDSGRVVLAGARRASDELECVLLSRAAGRPPIFQPSSARRHWLPRATMDPEAGEAPTPASAVNLRKPLRMTALYLVTFTALLVGASLAPTADAVRPVDKPANASARRVMEAPESRPSALSRVVAPLERDHAVHAPPADERPPAAVAVGDDDRGATPSSAPSSSSLPECAFHVYRHLSKTGGTTVRFVFDKQTAMGEWEYPLSYGFDEAQWTALLARWRDAATAWRAGDRPDGPRTLVEVRGNWPTNWPAENFERVLADVADLRREFGAPEDADAASASTARGACRVTTSALLREPTAQYLSFYDYYIRKHQEATPDPSRDRDKRWPDVPGPAAWGSDAGEWAARVPDMQTREMLGDKCTPQMRQPGYDVVWPSGEAAPSRVGARELDAECARVSPEDFDRFEATMRSFDVVGVTERFDEFLLALRDVAGVRHVEYVKSNEGSSGSGSGSSPRRLEDLPAEIADAVRSSTTMDRKAHELASRLMDERAERRFAGVGGVAAAKREAEAFRAATKEAGGRRFVGGFPPRSLHKWVAAADAERVGAKRVVPGCFTEETGGGQATAYIFFDPVALVDAQTDAKCVKGCNLDPPLGE